MVNESKNNIFTSAFTVSIVAIIFKVVAFLKQAVVAYYFGATLETDIYFIANGFVYGVGEAIVKSISMVILSVYITAKIRDGRDTSSMLMGSLLLLLLPVVIFLSFAFYILAPDLSLMIAPSYDAYRSGILSDFIRILSFLFIFIFIEPIGASILDAEGSYYIPRVNSLILSVFTILGCILFASRMGVRALVVSQYLASGLFVLILMISTRNYISFKNARFRDNHYLKTIAKLAFPLFIGNLAIQLNQIIDKAIASKFDDGAVSALSYSHVLEQLVTSVFIVNVGNIMFAHFSELSAGDEHDKLSLRITRTLNLMLIVLVPISIITFFQARNITAIVYFRGQFNLDALTKTSLLLAVYAIEFPAVAMRDILMKGMYALGETRLPVIGGVISIIINILSSIYLAKLIGILGIAIGTVISIYFGAVFNIYYFRKKMHVKPRFKLVFITALKCIPASLLSIVLILCVQVIGLPKSPVISFLMVSVITFILFGLVLFVLKVEELHMLKNMITKKFKL